MGQPTRKMQMLAGLNRRYVAVGGLVIFTLWLWAAYNRPETFQIRVPFTSTLADPASDVFDFPPLDSQPVRDMCAKTEWNPDLIFTCDNNHGGVGHVRNSVLNCVRYSISAGAKLVMPNIALRDIEHDHGEAEEPAHFEKRHGPGRQGMEYMFDKKHFIDSMRLSCPQLKLIDRMEQTAGDNRKGLQPESLFLNRPISGIEHPEEWSSKFYSWIEEQVTSTLSNEPIIVDLEQSFLQYPTHSDGHGVAHVFGDMLKIRADARRLATATLEGLSHWYELNLNLSVPIIKKTFFGAHLRTEDEMLLQERHVAHNPFEHFEGQAEAYLKQAEASKLGIMYVASGNDSETHRLSRLAEPYSIAVTHKTDLLKGRDRDELALLKYDQRALVDYLVLLKSSEFAGVGHSSFSWNVALKREEFSPQTGTYEEEKQIWTDKQSTLYGVRRGYVDSSGCMWP